MAATNISHDLPQAATSPHTGTLLVALASLSHEGLQHVLRNLESAFPGQKILVATPDAAASPPSDDAAVKLIDYPTTAPANSTWTLTASDFLNTEELVQSQRPRAIMQLGAEADSLSPSALHSLVSAVVAEGADLAISHYLQPPRAGLVTSAILYPLTRALFGVRTRFPLAIDLCLSPRMAERLATSAQRFTALNQPDALIWPVSEASVAGFKIADTEVGTRTFPQPGALDLNALLAQVTGSLFTDLDSKAAYWQRSRVAQPQRTFSPRDDHDRASSFDDVHSMIESFRLAYGNLTEIWSLVLPPHTLLGLKRLSVMPAESFAMPDSLWARTVYDFLLAYRLRTINRGHLLGALTPLYLAWVASHLLLTSHGTSPEQHVEAVAAAFEADKPYLVSRWRWPDRFNP